MSDKHEQAKRYWEEAATPLVKPRRSPDEQAQAAWDQILAVLRMLDSMIKDGARIRLSRSPVMPLIDHRDMMNRALATTFSRILRECHPCRSSRPSRRGRG